MSTETPTPVRRQSVTLRAGDSVSLCTGNVTRSVAIANLPRYVSTRLIANDLNALRSTFELTACAWTTEACHRYVAQCGQHPRQH